MKIFSLVLGIFVLLMAVVPCCSAEDTCAESECTGEELHGADEDFGHERPCSPFFSCGTCLGFVEAGGAVLPLGFPQEAFSQEYGVFKMAFSQAYFGVLLRPPAGPFGRR
ncbi:hypothetical protein J0A68_18945 [Algoriphagus sp. H41]|uniref:Secreted protein n=1 Tax=Algoriphagus oliviformis TaxID=2811231 RepID=A0ABS3CBM5_9BACT|nr:hypothetical protein [Algoriphagus oliviformis]MBN7813039.1 hypothetical protein [Algoriphagus oliviformis]